ncbi:MAG: hypothetical protein HUJ92_07215 [Bacteroidales bacterium]|nr:hypothetical protein [Bacteroidales bacterium]
MAKRIGNNKKRFVINYENMFPELQEAFMEKYPHGYADYMGDIFKVDKPDGTFFHVVSLETEDAVYLVRIKVHTDDIDEMEKNLFNDGADDDEPEGGDEGFPAEDGDFAGAPDDETEE